MRTVASVLGKASYDEQISSPHWLAFSKKMLAKFDACQCCHRSDIRRQVHHLFYDWERKLWEYDEKEVVVLCELCHRELHDGLKDFRKYVFRFLTPKALKTLNGALAVGLTQYDPLIFVHALAEFVSNKQLVENHAKAWSKP